MVTDDNSRARVDVSTIGQVTIDPNSRMTLVETRDAHHQLALERGTLHATISAPPGQFIVDTPSARATDLGCAYTLHVDEDGSGIIGVTRRLGRVRTRRRRGIVRARWRVMPNRSEARPRHAALRQRKSGLPRRAR